MYPRVSAIAMVVVLMNNYAASEAGASEVRVAAYGALGDGASDDGNAIRAALKAAPEGSTVVLEPGKTYLVHRMLRVERRGVKINGNGATIKFVVTDEEVRGPKGTAHTSIQLVAPNTSVYDLTITSNLPKRLAGHSNLNGIVLASEHQEARNNRIELVQTGIFARNAKNFVIANNLVSRTFSDGIHVTTGSWGGRIVGNTVRETGDDMIAVVGYGAGPPRVGNVLIENNTVSGQYWGRGITVVGGRDVTIRKNKISETTHGAGILIASETYFNTANVENVLVEDNEIINVQTTRPSYNPLGTHKRTGQGGIHVRAPNDRMVRNVLIRRNSINGTWKSGITVWGNSCQIGLQNNRLAAIGGKDIQINVTNPQECSVSCEGNTSQGQGVASTDCSGSLPNASGSSVVPGR